MKIYVCFVVVPSFSFYLDSLFAPAMPDSAYRVLGSPEFDFGISFCQRDRSRRSRRVSHKKTTLLCDWQRRSERARVSHGSVLLMFDNALSSHTNFTPSTSHSFHDDQTILATAAVSVRYGMWGDIVGCSTVACLAWLCLGGLFSCGLLRVYRYHDVLVRHNGIMFPVTVQARHQHFRWVAGVGSNGDTFRRPLPSEVRPCLI